MGLKPIALDLHTKWPLLGVSRVSPDQPTGQLHSCLPLNCLAPRLAAFPLSSHSSEGTFLFIAQGPTPLSPTLYSFPLAPGTRVEG